MNSESNKNNVQIDHYENISGLTVQVSHFSQSLKQPISVTFSGSKEYLGLVVSNFFSGPNFKPTKQKNQSRQKLPLGYRIS